MPGDEPQDHVREFTRQEVLSMSLHELNYSYAVDLYELIWEDIPGESPADSPNAPSDVGCQVVPNEGTDTITVTERRLFSARCPFCQGHFTHGQCIAKYRRGHAAHVACFNSAIHSGWNRCTI